ncbi:MAG: CHASE2 domain-containing protein, partial [Gammaproteobacteria bacterium]|nr:CHASE2 domain-containing protein [Gammaproteobacteria bacterium]
MSKIKRNLLLQFFVRCILYSTAGILALIADPFGLESQSDDASRDVFYRLISPLYSSKVQKDIVIVLLNEKSIQSLYDSRIIASNEWPILYQDHGYLISRIANYHPRAIFVDVYFKKNRSTDNTFDAMYRRIKRASDYNNVPMYFSRGTGTESLTPIQKKISELGQLTVNGWSGYIQGYPLEENNIPTVAAALYVESCGKDAPFNACSDNYIDITKKSRGPISVLWGNSPAPPVIRQTIKECSKKNIFSQLIGGLFSGILDINPEDYLTSTDCPFHQMIGINELIAIDKGIYDDTRNDRFKKQLEEALRDKIIFYAIDFNGVNNRIVTPVHGTLPSVFLHAMALDNLIQYGNNYVRTNEDMGNFIATITWLFIVIIF